MSHITESVEVAVPCRVAYDKWTQFDQFPRFMDGVDRVIQLDDRTLDWTATIAGRVKHWRAEVTKRELDRLIAWRSVDGARNDGSVRFESLGPDLTRITLELDVEPEGPIELAGDALGFVSRRARADMERFKAFVESGPDGGRGHRPPRSPEPAPQEPAAQEPS